MLVFAQTVTFADEAKDLEVITIEGKVYIKFSAGGGLKL